MPPSGYSVRQAGHLDDFLTSCLESLIAEADAGGNSVAAALSAEIASIRAVLRDPSLDAYSGAVLSLTAAFYEALAVRNPTDVASLREALPSVIDAFTRSILRIHVPG